MPLIWKEEYSTFNEKIDEQHKQLFRFVNKLELLLERESTTPAEIDSLLQFLKVYAHTHFHYEESCMRELNCPFGKENHDAHCNFKNALENSIAKYHKTGNRREMVNRMHQFITQWLTNHICEIDIQLRNH